MKLADLKDPEISFEVPKNSYVIGRGFTGEPVQVSKHLPPIKFKLGEDPKNHGLLDITYDVRIRFGLNTMLQIPNLLRHFNSLSATDEVEIPDLGHEGRSFFLVNGAIVIKNIQICHLPLVTRQLDYIVWALTEKIIIFATRKDTTPTFKPEHFKTLNNIIDGHVKIRETWRDGLYEIRDIMRRLCN